MQVVTPVLIPTVVTPFSPPGKPSDAISRAETEATTFAPIDQTPELSPKREIEQSPSSSEEQARNRQQEIVQAQQEREEQSSQQIQQQPNQQIQEQQQQAQEQQQLEQQQQAQQEQQDLAVIRELARRDREVRAHEQAHQAVGGRFAGAASFTFQRGPDGVAYAIGGEVPIDAGPVANNPEATIQKAQTVRRAALAPAQPSAQDRAVAAQATQLELQARQDLAIQQQEEAAIAEAERQADAESDEVTAETTTAEASETTQNTEEAQATVQAQPAGAEETTTVQAEIAEPQTELNRRNLTVYNDFVELARSSQQTSQTPIDLIA
ncbi:putative metalloprotease CJM1_0395 family protein [Spartinivicinus poritis]|uniref:Metalloprotease CJM1_0395 family protein n=1 Tax=Spartinivicinus poritis TaxID=2994640 RepID=A0ABT5U9U7_9GAMM|nr:putative metalloprotease CJM1_0395 family protein [Spartinivicinus sp. A2-2]MDE1463135.1 putative metalloprotease CJM1_0395 family protein [Spartinivicinus sp. A2-2]